MAKKYVPVIKEGTHLADSKNSPHAKRGTLLDNATNKVVGQAEWKEVKDSFGDSLKGKIVRGGLFTLGYYTIKKLADASSERRAAAEEAEKEAEKERIRKEIEMEEYRKEELRKVQEKIRKEQEVEERKQQIKETIKTYLLSAISNLFAFLLFVAKNLMKLISLGIRNLYSLIKAKYKKIKDKDAEPVVQTDDNTTIVSSMGMAFAPSSFSISIDKTIEDFKINMDNKDAQMRLLRILILSNELAKEIREFWKADAPKNPECYTEYAEWKRTMEKLTASNVAEYINYILENNIEAIEPSVLHSLMMDFYGYPSIGEHEQLCYIPLSQENIREALKL